MAAREDFATTDGIPIEHSVMLARPFVLCRFGSVVLLALGAVVAASACTGDDPTLTAIPANDGGGDTGAPLGTTCSDGKACPNGAPCVDGYCCDSPCSGVCEACNVAGSEGRCAAVSGTPRHGDCEGDVEGVCAGACDGTNRAKCTYPEVPCGAGSCAGGVATITPKCSAGTCPAATTQTCTLGCLEDGCLGVKQMAAGYYFVCAVLTDKRVRCWGSNEYGQTGQEPSTAVVETPTEVQGLTNVESVAATFNTMCALLSDKTVKCMGSNVAGELGQGAADSLKHKTPMTVPGLSDVTFIAGSSGGHFCAIAAGGVIRCWGTNFYGELGDGTTTPSPNAFKASPVTVCQPGVTPCAPSSGATFVAGGDNHTCAVFASGNVACWGNNSLGQLGIPADGVAHPFPAFVPGLTATYLTAGNQISCSATGGGAKCWGGNSIGRLGNGVEGGMASTPVSVCTKEDCSTLLSGVTGIATYDESTCALAGGSIKCWGSNTGGQLGDGNASASQNYAATSAIASGAVYVASGGQANYAIVVLGANRDIRCWGGEGSSQCGTGTPNANRKTPVAPKW